MVRHGIAVIGSANMDMVVVTRRFPEPGETVFGGQFGMFPGGKGANQAVCAAKLGGRVYFIGKMGRDVFRDKLVDSMKHDGVRLGRLTTDPRESTGIALITVDRGGQNEIDQPAGAKAITSASAVMVGSKILTSISAKSTSSISAVT